MNIDQDILNSYGAEYKTFKARETVFKEGNNVLFYFQIIKGKVKLNNYHEDGREFIHNILGRNQSFGDSWLFLEQFYYPTNAVCLEMSEIIRLPKSSFIEMLQKHPDLSIEMNACFSQQLYYKSIMMQNMASQNPVRRLIGLFDYLKSYQKSNCGEYFEVQLKRQQIANLTGLRVETVIRVLKKMEKEGLVQLKDRKILY